MGLEIEKKWLVDELPQDIRDRMERGDYHHTRIVQGYLCTEPVVRVRKDGDKYILTYKGKGRLSREEYEHPLTEEAFLKLIGKCDGFILEKERYRIPIPGSGGLKIELDVFYGEYEGLCYAEVEFPGESQAAAFQAPRWFGRELTNEKGWSNAALSLAKPQGLC